MWRICSVLDIIRSSNERPLVLIVDDKMQLRIVRPSLTCEQIRKISIEKLEEIIIGELN
ncbi:hypothetical protein SB6408_02334 [Klebsiella spallanzanii]|jgi:hypothetical protein|uniref:Uncharacterized protein n=1 Tax=Klebsiella spallanzanii TaxID=2587528 RepID=A0A564NK63_9ENTR|nr:hypothetical protein SB6408_02334 [Klebsiella spallanzanii]